MPPQNPSEPKALHRSWQVKEDSKGQKTYQETTPDRPALTDTQLTDWNGWNDTLKKARINFSKVPVDDAEEMDRHYRLIQDIKAKRDAAAKPPAKKAQEGEE